MNAMVCTRQRLLGDRIVTKTVEVRRGGGTLTTTSAHNTSPGTQATRHPQTGSSLQLTLAYVPTGYRRATDLAKLQELLRVLVNKSAGETLLSENSDTPVSKTSLNAVEQITDEAEDRVMQLATDATDAWLKAIPVNLAEHVFVITVPIFVTVGEVGRLDACLANLEMLRYLIKPSSLNFSLALDSALSKQAAIWSLMAGLEDDSADSTSACLRFHSAPPTPETPVERVCLSSVVFAKGVATGSEEVLEMRGYDAKLTPNQKVSHDIGHCQRVSGLSEFIDGRLHDACRKLESVRRCAEDHGGWHSVPAVLAAGYLSAIYYEWGELERVRCLQKERFEIALAASSLDSLLGFAQTRARAAALDGDMHCAYSTLQEVALVARRRRCVRLQVVCVAESIRFNLIEGKTAQAWRMGGAFDTLALPELPQEDDTFIETWQCQQEARCRLLLHGGRPRDAVELMKHVHSTLKSRGFSWLAAQSAVLLAIALEASAQPDAALTLLVEALIYGQINGLFRTFVDEGYIVAQMLLRLLARGDSPAILDSEYVGKLLAALGVDRSGARRPEEDAVVDSANLSSREADILRCVGRGLSNKEAARWLGITPETVKWHLKNIFRKLGVKSRIQAVRVGLEGELHRNGPPCQRVVSGLVRPTYGN
jgi:DNA-binding CsgD family transcriptional regulator